MSIVSILGLLFTPNQGHDVVTSDLDNPEVPYRLFFLKKSVYDEFCRAI